MSPKNLSVHHGQLNEKGRINSLDLPIEEHFQLPNDSRKQLSKPSTSFKHMKNMLNLFGRNKVLQIIPEAPHKPFEEDSVHALRSLLSREELPKNYDDYHTLLRFLRMQCFDKQKAKETFLSMLKWRADHHIDTISEDFMFEEYEEVKKCHPHGFHKVDKYGRPLYIERIGLLDLDALLKVSTVERLVKYHIKEQEKTLNLRFPACSIAAKKHIASITAILDVQGLSMTNFLKPARDLFIEIQRIDSNYYPETLHRLFIINAGSGFRALWPALKAFLSARTVNKINVLGSKYQSKLLELIDPSNLPKILGGECTCSEYGGCLRKDIGPWNDPEIKEMLKEALDMEQHSDNEMTSCMSFKETSENFGEELNFKHEEFGCFSVAGVGVCKSYSNDIGIKGNGFLDQSAQMANYDVQLLFRKISSELENVKQMLRTIHSSQGEIMKEMQQLRTLISSRFC